MHYIRQLSWVYVFLAEGLLIPVVATTVDSNLKSSFRDRLAGLFGFYVDGWRKISNSSAIDMRTSGPWVSQSTFKEYRLTSLTNRHGMKLILVRTYIVQCKLQKFVWLLLFCRDWGLREREREREAARCPPSVVHFSFLFFSYCVTFSLPDRSSSFTLELLHACIHACMQHQQI